MKKTIYYLCIVLPMAILLISCKATPSSPVLSGEKLAGTTKKEAVTATASVTNGENVTNEPSVTEDEVTKNTTSTSVTNEENVTNESNVTENEMTKNTTTTTCNSSSIPLSHIKIAGLDYWPDADSFRIIHTESPPFKAITLKKGTEEYNTLLSFLLKIEGTYLETSQEGIYGGFIPIFVYQENTQLDRITIDITGNARFSTDKQQEDSKKGSFTQYPSLYSMSEELSKQIQAFFETLEYSENI